MGNIFFSLSCLFGILLLSGCGDDPITPLEQASGKIAEQAIIKELNKESGLITRLPRNLLA